MSDATSTVELDTLLTQLVSGDISHDETKRLQDRLGRDSKHLDYCRDFMMVSAGLQRLLYEEDEEASTWLKNSLQDELSKSTSVRTVFPWKQTLTSIAAMIMIGLSVTYVVVNRGGGASSHLGEVINGLGAKWADPALTKGRSVSLGTEQRHLVEGLAEIKLAGGTRVILQGPSRFSLENGNQMFLNAGTLTAKVPQAAKGFVLRAQRATVVDYGTEFGVLAKSDGSLETHVFAGKVKVTGPAGSQPITLDTGASVLMRPNGEAQLGQIDKQRFPRRLPAQRTRACPGKRLDLADLIGGGNGYGTGRLGQGIDPANGQTLEGVQGQRRHTRQAGFVRLDNNRYIDGVFVPAGSTSAGQVQVAINSQGLRFDRIPVTDGSYYDGIFNGARFMDGGQARTGTLDGEDYGTAERPALSLHPNAGITFDLQAIAADSPGVSVKAFRALCGISENAGDAHRQTTDFWVLVDGELAYHHQCLPGEFSTGLLNVDLDARAHYLTLVTTCAGDPAGSWGFFGNPTLEFTTSGP